MTPRPIEEVHAGMRIEMGTGWRATVKSKTFNGRSSYIVETTRGRRVFRAGQQVLAGWEA